MALSCSPYHPVFFFS